MIVPPVPPLPKPPLTPLTPVTPLMAKPPQGPVSPILGQTTPRIFTPPKRELTPATSDGFAAVEWIKNVLGFPLLPHQEFLTIHLLELNEDGSRRFDTALILQGRQSGKTTWTAAFLLWRALMDECPEALCAAQNRAIAFEMLERAHRMLEESTNPSIRRLIPLDRTRGLMTANGKERMRLHDGTKFEVSAMGRNAGRGKSPQTLVLDELRTVDDAVEGGFASLEPTTSAQPVPLNIYLSNAGTDRSIVLNELEDRIRGQIANGEDPEIFYASYSADDDADISDVRQWAKSIPTLNRLTPEKRIATKLSNVNVFKSEYLNIRVSSLTPSLISPVTWESLGDDQTLEGYADRLCMFVDIAPTMDHATVMLAAQMADGARTRLQLALEARSTAELVQLLPGLKAALTPVRSGFFGDGPTLSLASELEALGFEKIPSSTEACAGLVEAVTSHRILHLADPMLTAHIANTQKLPASEGFRFSRKHSTGAIDGAYAAAGALFLVRTFEEEEPKPKAKLFVFTRED